MSRVLTVTLAAAALACCGLAPAAAAHSKSTRPYASLPHLGPAPQRCFQYGSSNNICGKFPSSPYPPNLSYLYSTYYGTVYISPHVIGVGQDVTATEVPDNNGRPSWGHPPGKRVSGCKDGKYKVINPQQVQVIVAPSTTCTWKATSASAYPPKARAPGGGYDQWNMTFCGFFGCASSGDFYYVLPRKKAISGMVLKDTVNSAGHVVVTPVGGEAIHISGRLNGSATTQKDGFYDALVDPGRYTVSVASGGYSPTQCSPGRISSEACKIDVRGGDGVASFAPESCPILPHSGFATASPDAIPAQASPGPAPTIDLKANPVNVDPANGGQLPVTATVSTQCPLAPAKVDLTLKPSFNLMTPSEFDTFTKTSASKSQTFDVGGGKTVDQPFGPFTVGPVVVKDGFTIAGMNKWTSSGWAGSARPKEVAGGGELVYSDAPEFLADSTNLRGGGAGGSQVEGVLYRESGKLSATEKSSDFRIYLNHENRTSTPKSICVVEDDPRPIVLTSTVRVSERFAGLAQNNGNPVQAGADALRNWEHARRNPSSGAHLLGAHSIHAGTAYAKCIASLGPGNGTTGPVVNAIIDMHADGPIQIGVVAVNQGKSGAREKAFEGNPLGFKFADQKHPGGDPSRTYKRNGSLSNAGEHHVHGTFPYDQIDVTLPNYDLDTLKRVGYRLADKPSASPPGEYLPAMDSGGVKNDGNYGVLYQVSVDTSGKTNEAAQVLLDPRGVGPVPGPPPYTNGYAGVVDVPATPPGSIINTPNPSDPNLGDQESFCPNLTKPTAGNKNVVCSDLGIGIGRVDAGKTFSLAFMLPGGAAGPLAVVLAPAFIKADATLTYNEGGTRPGSVKAAPKIIVLKPTGT